jgi:hypothetical protein
MKLARQWIVAVAAIAVFAGPAFAQESSYTPGTVWNISNIEVQPGQFEKYMDYLAGDWKKLNEFGKKEGYVVSYHVLQVNNARTGEPNLILAVEYRDYFGNAEQLAQQKKLEAFLASSTRKMDTEFGGRVTMRKTLGGMELQELKLK